MRFWPSRKRTPSVSVVRLEGVIVSSGRMRSSVLCDEAIAPHLERAFAKGKPKAVALAVNSPGGSPVQASLISARIRRLSREKGVPVYAFVEDLAVSGGYWIACAAEEIYADPNSIVGSIGVISSSFGFQDLLKRAGIERRVHTAGDDKNAWDPFLPEKAEDVARLKEIQGQLHDNFIRHVEERRGGKLNGKGLFTGKFWTGSSAAELGLVDGIGHLVPRMKEMFGDKAKFRVYGKRRRFLTPFASQLVDSASLELDERAMRARYGA